MLQTPVQLRPLTDVDFGEFTAAFNRAYSDYFLPITMSVPGFRALVQRDDVDLSASLAALHNDTIIGMGLLGIRGHAGWIGGMGVVPAFRRRGIGRAMMRGLLGQAALRGLDHLRLEVIDRNEAAHALYRELGFADERVLHVLHRPTDGPLPPGRIDLTAQTRPVDEVLSHYDSFHNVRQCWQRGKGSLAGLAAHAQGWEITEHGQVVAFGLGWANRMEIRLADLATYPGCDRTPAAYSLLAHLHGLYPQATGMHYNVAEDDPTLAAYLAAGYASHMSQFEMKYEVTA